MHEYVENCISENAALRRKLQSKTEAVLILSKELDQCRTERDQFKLMAEQLQDRYSNLKRKTQDMGMCHASLYLDEGRDCLRPGITVAQLLGETREQNKALRIQMENLKQQLHDAYGDIKVLRAGNAQHRTNTAGEVQAFPDHHKEELVQQLETLSFKCSQLEADLQAILDEKEDLVSQRDVYKCKVHRLNHELAALMKGGKKGVDIDALIMENRYLNERLQQTQEEQEATKRSMQKYKSALDQKRTKGPSSSTGVISHKQVKEMLDAAAHPLVPNTNATMESLRSVCQALFDALEDKSLRLAHQKKANRILAKRVVDLEELAGASGTPLFPSQLLLGGYSGSEVDRDTEHSTEADSAVCSSPDTVTVSKATNNKNPVTTERGSPSTLIRSVPPYTGGAELRSPLSSASDLEDCHPLPPQVQVMVQRALEELQQESANMTASNSSEKPCILSEISETMSKELGKEMEQCDNGHLLCQNSENQQRTYGSPGISSTSHL